MRLEKKYIELFKDTALRLFGSNIRLYLFGSRVDDCKSGGDIDLYLETNLKQEIYQRKIRFLVEVKKITGERKIDLVINNGTDENFIYEVAKREGIILI